MNFNKKSIKAIILSVLIIALSIVGLPYSKANASSTITDKSKVALYYRERNYCYHGTIQYRNLIKVPKEFRDKCTVSLKYKLSIDNAWTSKKAEFYKSLDDQYDIYVASCGRIDPEYECYIECEYNNNCYIDDNNGKYYTGEILGDASLCALRTRSYLGSSKYQIKALVKNIAYNKDVRVRYTTDNWKTQKEEALCYVETNDNGDEIWACEIDTSKANSKEFKYAISYTVNKQTYWDNNFYQDYDSTYRHSY